MRYILDRIQNVFRVYREADAITQNEYERIFDYVVIVVSIIIGIYGMYLGFSYNL